MPVLTRRCDPDRADCWRIYFGDVRVGMIGRATGNPNAAECWQWSCGFYPGSELGEHRHGTAPTFEAARAEFATSEHPAHGSLYRAVTRSLQGFLAVRM